MKRIVILGDSLSLPRPEEGVLYENTYMYKLFKENYEIINRARRENDTFLQSRLWNLYTDIKIWNPDIVIIFLGIVDCAPRLFSRRESKVISYLPNFIRSGIINFFSKRRKLFTKLRKITYVSEKDFYNNLVNIIDYIGEKKVILIKIVEVSEELERRSFNYLNNIKKYNKLIEKCAKERRLAIIDPNKLNVERRLLSDGYHITSELHQEIYKKLEKILKNSNE